MNNNVWAIQLKKKSGWYNICFRVTREEAREALKYFKRDELRAELKEPYEFPECFGEIDCKHPECKKCECFNECKKDNTVKIKIRGSKYRMMKFILK
jgi:hypothetical protein